MYIILYPCVCLCVYHDIHFWEYFVKSLRNCFYETIQIFRCIRPWLIKHNLPEPFSRRVEGFQTGFTMFPNRASLEWNSSVCENSLEPIQVLCLRNRAPRFSWVGIPRYTEVYQPMTNRGLYSYYRTPLFLG